MAAASFAPNLPSGRRIPLAEINAAVAARLGPTRGLGNSQPACFNRDSACARAYRQPLQSVRPPIPFRLRKGKLH